jgi:hypothetical protein
MNTAAAAANDLRTLETEIDHAVRSTHRANVIGLFLFVAAILLVGFWLYYAYRQFAAVDPKFAAGYAQARLTDYLPQAGTDLQASLIDNAPRFIAQVESRVQALPDRFADELNSRTRAELRQAEPQMTDEIYKSMRTALEQSKDSAKGPDDAARFKSLLDALADAYREESVKLVDQVRATHAKNGSDVVEYIKLLGENKNLDRRQQLHRDMLQQFFIVAQKQAPAVIPPAGK